MADTLVDTEVGAMNGVTDIRLTRSNAGTAPGNFHGGTAYNDIGLMRASLAASIPAYYTAAVLNNLTVNDMVYAMRLIEGGSIR